MSKLPEPISRKDTLLHNIADGTPDITDLIPISREEVYLKYIAENGTSGNYDESFKGIIERTATNVDLPNGVTTLGDYVFYKYSNLQYINIPSSVTTIGTRAFYACSSLAITSLPSGIISIDSNAFSECKALKNITFQGTPNSISSTTFKGCTNLTVIRVPWAEGEVAGSPFGASNATIVYNYTE